MTEGGKATALKLISTGLRDCGCRIKKKIWMWKKDEVQKVTRSNREVSNREELEWLVNAIKDSKEITRKVTV